MSAPMLPLPIKPKDSDVTSWSRGNVLDNPIKTYAALTLSAKH
jgi:hypothetical protein